MPRPQREKRKAARVVRLATAVAACTLAVACGKKDIAPVPPTPAVAAPAPELPRVRSEPVSEPQIVATLPPEQPIPPEALPDVPAPLAVDPPRRATDPAEGQNAGDVPDEPAKPAAPAATTTQTPSLRLGRILTPEERETFNESIEESLSGRPAQPGCRASAQPESGTDRRGQTCPRLHPAGRGDTQRDLPLAGKPGGARQASCRGFGQERTVIGAGIASEFELNEPCSHIK